MSHNCVAACVAGWQASRRCHCAGCGNDFTTEANFMKHFDNDSCADPGARGLVQNQRGVWMKEGEVDWSERQSRGV